MKKLYYITLESNYRSIADAKVIKASDNGYTYVFDDYHKANGMIYKAMMDGKIDRRDYCIIEILESNVNANKLYKCDDSSLAYKGDIELIKLGGKYGYDKTYKVK